MVMRRHVTMAGLLLVAGLVLGLTCLDSARAGEPELFSGMTWVATVNWLGCDQQSVARECAEWQTPEGTMLRTCCVAAEALGTSDPSACVGGGFTRGDRAGL